MNGNSGIAPRPIEARRLLLGEGKEEEIFLEACLKHLGVSGVQIENYGGKSNLAPFLQALKRRSGFAQVEKLSIIRDADDDPVGAASSVDNAIAKAAFAADLTIKRLIVPGSNQVGSLENLCLKSIAGQPIEACVEEYMDCAARATGHVHATTTNKAKARIHAWLAAHPKPDLRLGLAAAGGLIDWTVPAFDELTAFVRELS